MHRKQSSKMKKLVIKKYKSREIR